MAKGGKGTHWNKSEASKTKPKTAGAAQGGAPTSPSRNPEHHGRDYLMAAGAAIAEFLAIKYGAKWLAWFAALLSWLAIYDWTGQQLKRLGKRRWLVYAVAALMLIVAAHLMVNAKVQPADNVQSAMPFIAMQCEMGYLPITVAPHSEVTIFGLHEPPEFFVQQNNEDVAFRWPSKQQLVKGGLGNSLYVCKVASLNGPAENVLIPLTVTFGQKEVKTTMRFPLLDRGQAAIYVVNQCPVSASIIMPDTATVQSIGDSKPREVPLHGAWPSSVEKIMIFFASNVHWENNPKCS